MRASVLKRDTPSGTTHTDASSGIAVEHAGQGVVEHGAVVDARAHHHLAVHLDAVVEQGPQPAQAGGAAPVAQHLGPHPGVGGVDADVERAQALGQHPLEVGLGEAGEGREVAVQERQPVVVVLEVQAAPQARRQLVDEAELAVVVAGAHPVEQRRVHLDAERLARALVDLDERLEATPPHLDRQVGLVDQRAPLEQVAGDVAVDRRRSRRPRPGRRSAAGEPGATATTRGADMDVDSLRGRHGFRCPRRRLDAPRSDLGPRGQGVRRGPRTGIRSRVGRRLPTGECRRTPVATLAPMPVDKVLLAAPRGFCAGVEMAIKALAWMVRAFEPPVYCYHEIVHNQLVVDRFRDLGVVFVDDIDEVPEGRPIMLSAHGSAPEVVAAARERGSYVVNAVCPLVTKVHHEVKIRAGKGFRIVYVGHEGHEEAVGTMAVAPDAIDRVESVAEVDALAADRPAGRPAGPDHPLAPRLGGHRRAHRRALPRPVAARAQRPLLRHHQPAVGAGRDRPPLRRGRRHRLGQLVQHPGAREAGPRVGQPAGVPGQRRRRAARRPARHRRGHRRRLGARGAGRAP